MSIEWTKPSETLRKAGVRLCGTAKHGGATAYYNIAAVRDKAEFSLTLCVWTGPDTHDRPRTIDHSVSIDHLKRLAEQHAEDTAPTGAQEITS